MNANVRARVVIPVKGPGTDLLPRPHWLPGSVWPFETSALAFEGSRIAVTDVGRGPALLFVHTGFWSIIWRQVMERLAQDFRCVTFDAPGTGRSDRLPLERVSLAKAARAATAVIQALDLDDITLVAHDLGGPTGIAGAAAAAERIRGICAVNAFAWKPTGAAFRGMLALMGSAPMREVSAWTGVLARVTSSPFGIGRTTNEAGRKAFVAGIGRQGMRTFHTYLRDARRATAMYHELGRALTGPFRRIPLATIFGERNDPLGFQQRWKKLFPDARQVVVPKGNHFPMCDDPDLVAATIREWHGEKVGRR